MKKQQKPASDQELKQRIQDGNTQGRAGAKLPRINVAFRSDNADFVRVMARAKGMTSTAFINYLIEQYRHDHEDLYRQALELQEKLKK